MLARLNHVRETLRTSLWFLPTLMSLAVVGLALLTLRLDAALQGDEWLPPAIGFRAGPEAARALLTTLSGAMMGVTGVTFSITVVALSLASQQFGPRLLRNFLRDRTNHFVLGTFLATFLYSLLVLQEVDAEQPDALPRLSITVAMVLALMSLAVLIYFVHHIAHGIQADAVIASVSDELTANVDRMYPERMGDEPEEDAPAALVPERFEETATVVRARESGYLQAVDESDLLRIARREDVVMQLVPRPGDFVIEGSPLILLWPAERRSQKLEDELHGLLILGGGRTAEQDVEFSIDQLVEVAVRSLSPGINDPFTAIRCVDRLAAALCRLASRRFPSPYRVDDDGKLRVIARRPGFDGLVQASFNQIREYGRGSVAVTIRLLEVIEIIGGCARGRERLRAPLRDQLARTYAGARVAGHSEEDLRDIERRYRDAARALEADAAEGVAMQPRKRSEAES